jgi:hypothetical protein
MTDAPNSNSTPSPPVPQENPQEQLLALQKEVHALKLALDAASPAKAEALKAELKAQQDTQRQLQNLLSLIWIHFQNAATSTEEGDKRATEQVKENASLFFNQIKLDPAQWTDIASS